MAGFFMVIFIPWEKESVNKNHLKKNKFKTVIIGDFWTEASNLISEHFVAIAPLLGALVIIHCFSFIDLTQPSWTLNKKPFERLIFPTKYVIPKSLSRLAIG